MIFKITSTCKGGGYLYCRTDPPHPRANPKGLYPLHRVLMENELGRLLLPGEVVHHKDGNKQNNDVNNLEAIQNSEHSRHHQPEQPIQSFWCPSCGTQFELKAHVFRLRNKRNKLGVFCSRACAGKRRPKLLLAENK